MSNKHLHLGLSIRQVGVVLAGVLAVGAAVAEEEATESLTLQEAITRALENNGEIAIERLNPLIQDEQLKMAKAAFDVTFESTYTYQSIETPQNAEDFVATGGGVVNFEDTVFGADGSEAPATADLLEPNIYEEENQISTATFTKKFSPGTTIEMGSTLTVLDNSLNRQSESSMFNPEYESFTGITLTQSLLKDGGRRVNLTEIRIAKSNLALADLEWRSRTAMLVGDVMKRYYDAAFAYENMLIQRDAIGLAEKLLEDSRKRLEQGVAKPNDVNVAEGGVCLRQEEALLAENMYMERQNALQLLFKASTEAGKAVTIRAADPLLDEVSIPSRAELLACAWSNRYELQQAEEVIHQRRDQTYFAKNQVKPRLDVVFSGGMHGLDGSTEESYSEAYDGQGPEWAAGVNFSVPLSFSRQKAQYRQAKHQEAQAGIDFERVKVQISLEIDTVLSRLKTDRERLITARKSREVALKTLEAETLRLKEGVSTSFQVLEYQKDYAKTRSREIAALADLNKDMVDIWLTTSQLLERRNISVETPVSEEQAAKAKKLAEAKQIDEARAAARAAAAEAKIAAVAKKVADDKAAEEKKRMEAAKIAEEKAAAKARADEEKRVANEKKLADRQAAEARELAEEKKAEEARAAAKAKKIADEQAEEARELEEKKQAAELKAKQAADEAAAKAKAEEEKRVQEAQDLANKKQAEEARAAEKAAAKAKAAEEKRAAEAKKAAEEQAEEARELEESKQAAAAKAALKAKQAEEKAAAKAKVEEERRAAEAKRAADEKAAEEKKQVEVKQAAEAKAAAKAKKEAEAQAEEARELEEAQQAAAAKAAAKAKKAEAKAAAKAKKAAAKAKAEEEKQAAAAKKAADEKAAEEKELMEAAQEAELKAAAEAKEAAEEQAEEARELEEAKQAAEAKAAAKAKKAEAKAAAKAEKAAAKAKAEEEERLAEEAKKAAEAKAAEEKKSEEEKATAEEK